MGYYSKVAVIVPKPNYYQLVEAVKAIENETDRKNTEYLLNEFTVKPVAETDFLLTAEYVKWYYDLGANFIERFLRNECDNYEFLRVGEEFGDQEHDCEGYDHSRLDTTVEIHYYG